MKNVSTLSLVGAVALASAALAGTAVAAPARAKAPTRHVICSKTPTWIPADYDGGCYLSFSQQVRRIAYNAFAEAADNGSDWKWGNASGVAPLIGPAFLAAMDCSRGGTVALQRLNKWQAGTCTWNDTFGHYGLGDHPDHEWECSVTVVLRSSMNGKSRMRKGRLWMQWDVTGAPLDDGTRLGGEFPHCGKDPSTDDWFVN